MPPPSDLVMDLVRERNRGDRTLSFHPRHDGSEVRSCGEERGITADKTGSCDGANIPLIVRVGHNLGEIALILILSDVADSVRLGVDTE